MAKYSGSDSYELIENRTLAKITSSGGLIHEMTRILKKYDRSIFTISPNFIRVAFPFSNIIGNEERGGLNGGLNGGLIGI